MRTTLILGIGAAFCAALLVACGSGEPKNYEDYVLKAMQQHGG